MQSPSTYASDNRPRSIAKSQPTRRCTRNWRATTWGIGWLSTVRNWSTMTVIVSRFIAVSAPSMAERRFCCVRSPSIRWKRPGCAHQLRGRMYVPYDSSYAPPAPRIEIRQGVPDEAFRSEANPGDLIIGFRGRPLAAQAAGLSSHSLGKSLQRRTSLLLGLVFNRGNHSRVLTAVN